MTNKVIYIDYQFDVSYEDNEIKESFLSQIKLLLNWDYIPIAESVLNYKLNDNHSAEKNFVLLFNSNQMKYIYIIKEVLEHYSIPYTCFIDPLKIDKFESHNLINLIKAKQNALVSYGYEYTNVENDLKQNINKLEKLLDINIGSVHSHSQIIDCDLFEISFLENIKKSYATSNCINLKTTTIKTDEKSFNFWYKVYKSEINQLKV